ncbi:MAG: IS110 family transposase [Terriglobia bacterium]|nr:IS110 family transposase [Terriglobia bacterium]
MEVLHPHCAGLDIHKDSVVACVRHMAEGKIATEVKSFLTTTRELMELSDWLSAEGATHIAMEATGVYWKPVWHILADGEFELVLANAAHVKNVPGRKTDVKDAVWLADLMAHGLIRGSFVPDAPTQQMRDLLRTRKQFVRERSSHIQRIQKALEDANIKLDSVVSDVLGLSGRRMIEALIAGETDPLKLAVLAHRRIQASAAELEAALRGRVTAHHRFLLQLHLDHVDALDAAIARIDREVDGNVEPFRAAIELLTTIPGVSRLSAEVIVSEIGLDMERFATDAQLISWAGLCPRNDESAGKRRSTQMKKGAPWLKTTLIQCAWSATRNKNGYLAAQYVRLRSRRGGKKAIGAVAASILTAIHHMLKNGTRYQDLGADHFDRRAKGKHVLRLLRRLQNLGVTVQITSSIA